MKLVKVSPGKKISSYMYTENKYWYYSILLEISMINNVA